MEQGRRVRGVVLCLERALKVSCNNRRRYNPRHRLDEKSISLVSGQIISFFGFTQSFHLIVVKKNTNQNRYPLYQKSYFPIVRKRRSPISPTLYTLQTKIH
jgi:hypothetical protein